MSIEQMDKPTLMFYMDCADKAGVSLEEWIKNDYFGEEY